MGFFRNLKGVMKNQMRNPNPQSQMMPLPKQGITSLPQQNLNLEFLNSLPKNMMPNVDFSSLPQASQDTSNIPEGFGVEQNRRTGEEYFLQQLTPEQKAQNMIPERRNISYDTQDMMGDIQFGPGNQFGGNLPGYAAGQLVKAGIASLGGLGRAKNLKDIPYQGMIGTKAGLGSGKFTTGQPGQLLAAARGASINDNLRRGTEAAVGALGVGAIDATQGFSEEASRRNMMFNSPEQFGKDLAGLKIGFDQVMQIATNKAQEIGDVTGEYVDRVSRAYGEEMENRRMQEIDAQQGMQPFSLLTGPDMPLRQQRMIESGIGQMEMLPSSELQVNMGDTPVRQEMDMLPEYSKGGPSNSSFPDLTGDGELTYKDILVGRGVDFKYAGGETTVTAPRLPQSSGRTVSDADRFLASYVNNPIEDESNRRKSVQEELQELLQTSGQTLSEQDLMMIQNMMDQGERQPYQMV